MLFKEKSPQRLHFNGWQSGVNSSLGKWMFSTWCPGKKIHGEKNCLKCQPLKMIKRTQTIHGQSADKFFKCV